MFAKIPIDSRFWPRILEGSMMYHAMTRVYAQPRDHFFILGHKIFVVSVTNSTLGDLSNFGYKAQGCDSPYDFIDYWKHYHPRMGYKPEKVIYLHWFEPEKKEVVDYVQSRNWCPFCPCGQIPDPFTTCEHFVGYAGHCCADNDDVVVNTPVSRRVYRKPNKCEVTNVF